MRDIAPVMPVCTHGVRHVRMSDAAHMFGLAPRRGAEVCTREVKVLPGTKMSKLEPKTRDAKCAHVGLGTLGVDAAHMFGIVAQRGMGDLNRSHALEPLLSVTLPYEHVIL